MGTLKTTFGNVLFNVSQGLDHVKSTFSNIIDSIVGGVSVGMESLINGDVIGIDTTQIPTMQKAIDDYVVGLNDQLAKMQASAETDGAYKGDYATAVTEFIAAVKTCCYNVISQLLAFKDQLTEIEAKYQDNDTALKSDIGDQANELSQSYQAYESSQQ